ncbi:MAG: Fis family transcriptional regulator [Gammaproteobacteria bacterium]|nr:Fis family transcriptional regulator [Gammaproteobacteria bacterium]
MTPTRKKKKINSQKIGNNGAGHLSENVKTAMDRYFHDLDGQDPADLYQLIMTQIEVPLFESVLDYTEGNVSRAADMLGLNRGTLRNRLRKYKIG